MVINRYFVCNFGIKYAENEVYLLILSKKQKTIDACKRIKRVVDQIKMQEINYILKEACIVTMVQS